MNRSRPSLLQSTVLIVLLTALWGYLRLFLFSETIFPITFVLPLLICVWTGRRWQLWGMATTFAVMAILKFYWILPPQKLDAVADSILLGATLFNIVMGAIVVQVILKLRENLEFRNQTITAQNTELETQAEELSQQNEEIKAQSEELAEQNEEIEAQSEEVARQNEDLVDLNSRLSGREDILQGLLKASRELDSITQALNELSQRALSVIGVPANAIIILEREKDVLKIVSQAGINHDEALVDEWPLTGSIAEVVLKEGKTAYVSDLAQRPDLAQPFGGDGAFRSLLATPLKFVGPHAGLLVAASKSATHWTEDQFKVIEWVAAQCGLLLETLHAQKELAEHTRALEAANQSKDRFLAMLSHELRTPLTPVLAISGMLENDDQLSAEVRESFRMIRRNVGIQSRLIDDLLDLTRISRGKVELDRQTLLVRGLLQDTLPIVSLDLQAKAQTLQLDIAGLNSHVVMGDRARLQQVVWNLLKNAIKFSGQRSTITLRGRVENDLVCIEVADSGCGIRPEDLERIFMPFEQSLGRNRQAVDTGLGLGLTIAKAIVELHGGKISARSEGLEKGATFKVVLPIHTDKAISADHETVNPPEATLPTIPSACILLVEDHADSGRIMATLLRKAGHRVEHAETAAAAFRLFQETPFDLLISDLGLPDESGLELMQRMRQHRPELRGICLSGYGMEKDVAACHAAGFKEHLTKPVEITRLKAAVARVMAAS